MFLYCIKIYYVLVNLSFKPFFNVASVRLFYLICSRLYLGYKGLHYSGVIKDIYKFVACVYPSAC